MPRRAESLSGEVLREIERHPVGDFGFEEEDVFERGDEFGPCFGAGLVVAESDRRVDAAGWDVVALKRHGGTVVTQLRPRGACRL